MRIITISREFGSGGRELGKRMADHLSCDYYDSEIITAVAEKSRLDAGYVENMLSDSGWRSFPITFRHSLAVPIASSSTRIELLLLQKQVIEDIAALGRDFIIVGRNADVLLERYHPFNVFVCADHEAKIARCMERAPQGEQLTEKELSRKMKQIDRDRSQTRALMSGSPWGETGSYHLTVNTTGWQIKHLAPAVAAYAQAWFEQQK